MKGERFVYSGSKTREISFPLGGIGTGCLGLAGNGRLVDWEIFGRPNKGSTNGFSHFAVKAEADGEVLDARVLNGDLHPPYSGVLNGGSFGTFGFGPPRQYLSGVPHFREVEFVGRFPIAELKFSESKFPGEVSMTAFNPFIPLNDRDSGIPAAFFELRVENTTDRTLTYSLCLSVNNPFPTGTTVNAFSRDRDVSQITLSSTRYQADEPEYGNLCVATDAVEMSYQEYWYRGSWFDNLGIFWKDLTTPGRFENRTYSEPQKSARALGREDPCVLAAHVTARVGETAGARFVLSWHFPNCVNYWRPECDAGDECCKPTVWSNYYATQYADSRESAHYGLRNWNRLYDETLEFQRCLFDSTLPDTVIDAVSANIAVLKTPTCLRLEDGTFYGFEGCHPQSGCCEGSCQHVWNYAYALPFLFPHLERSMRDAEYEHNLGADGDMTFRLQLPLGRERPDFRPCADGQFGTVIKAYREWKISGDSEWLRSHWEHIKRSMEWAWSENNPDKWDLDRDGVLEGRQHHTLDMELFGPNSWLTGFYLAALKAAAEMADHLGEGGTAGEYRGLFSRGKSWVDENLFNGEYYHQQLHIRDKSMLEGYPKKGRSDDDALEAYWDAEHGEIKYQVAEGCGIDQVVAQWHANLVGLGRIFDARQTRIALESIFRYNFKRDMRDHFNPCRVFCVNDEAGVVMCEYPRGKQAVPVPYAEESMHGFEYQVAGHMIQEGLVDQGLEIVKAVRDRYDGENRNPWNEIECGSNYARSMASYALLAALSGFEFDRVTAHIGFSPRINADAFRTFWCLEGCWGVFSSRPDRLQIDVVRGTLELSSFASDLLRDAAVKSTVCGSQACPYGQQGRLLTFDPSLAIEGGSSLVIEI